MESSSESSVTHFVAFAQPGEQLPPTFQNFSELADDLEALCALGMIEAFRDGAGSVSYRPIVSRDAA